MAMSFAMVCEFVWFWVVFFGTVLQFSVIATESPLFRD